MTEQEIRAKERKEVYSEMGQCVHRLFCANMMAVIGMVIIFIPFLGWIGSVVLSLAALGLELYAFYQARYIDADMELAFKVTIVQLCLSLAGNFFGEWAVVELILNIASTALGVLVIYWVCAAAGRLLTETGHEDLANRAKLVVKLQVAAAAVDIVTTTLTSFSSLEPVTWTAAIVELVVVVGVLVVELKFYNDAAYALRTAGV